MSALITVLVDLKGVRGGSLSNHSPCRQHNRAEMREEHTGFEERDLRISSMDMVRSGYCSARLRSMSWSKVSHDLATLVFPSYMADSGNQQA